jgi:hypothetical protein
MEDLVGKKVYGFKFFGGPGFTYSMNDLIGKEAEIIAQYPDSCTVQFDKGGLWSYPYPEILLHLVEEDKPIEEIILNIKQLTSELWKKKI